MYVLCYDKIDSQLVVQSLHFHLSLPPLWKLILHLFVPFKYDYIKKKKEKENEAFKISIQKPHSLLQDKTKLIRKRKNIKLR